MGNEKIPRGIEWKSAKTPEEIAKANAEAKRQSAAAALPEASAASNLDVERVRARIESIRKLIGLKAIPSAKTALARQTVARMPDQERFAAFSDSGRVHWEDDSAFFLALAEHFEQRLTPDK